MPPQAIHDAVTFLRARGHTAAPAGPDSWYVHITFPYFPSLTIDEHISSSLLVDVYATLSGRPLIGSYTPAAD